MKTKVFLGVALRIIIFFTVSTFATFLPEHLREFFGDHFVVAHEQLVGKDHSYFVNERWDWGARHYWFCAGMTILFLLTLVNMIIGIVKIIKKEYPQI